MYTFLQNARWRRCGVPPPPSSLFETVNITQTNYTLLEREFLAQSLHVSALLIIAVQLQGIILQEVSQRSRVQQVMEVIHIVLLMEIETQCGMADHVPIQENNGELGGESTLGRLFGLVESKSQIEETVVGVDFKTLTSWWEINCK